MVEQQRHIGSWQDLQQESVPRAGTGVADGQASSKHGNALAGSSTLSAALPALVCPTVSCMQGNTAQDTMPGCSTNTLT